MTERLKNNEKIKKLNKPKKRPSYSKNPENSKKSVKEKLKKTSKRTKEIYKIKKGTKENLKNYKKEIEKSKNIDISTFEKKVLEPVSIILREAGYKNFDTELLLKIGLIENMGGKGSKTEFEAALKKFSNENYKNLTSVRSHVGARGIFQVMPNTARGLNRIYKIPNLIAKNKAELQKNYGYKKEDFDILLNALQGAFMLIDTEKNYGLNSDKELAGAYNMGPAGFKNSMRRGRLNNETSAYLKKMSYASNNLERYTT